MKPNIKLDFKSQALKPSLEPLAQRVLEYFDFLSQSVYIYVADREDPNLTNPNALYYVGGKHFRGVHTPPEGMHLLPEYLKECVFRPDSELMWLEESPTFLEMLAFEHMIYIRKSTCADVTGFVLTLAHELQHVNQYVKARKILRANSLLYHQVRQIDPATTLRAIDIPHEREANIVSKKIAEAVCGEDTVEAFASEQIRQFAELAKAGDSDAVSERFRWEVFQSLETSAPFDLQVETISLFNKYKPQIIALDLGRHYDIDATKEQWWI